MLSRTLAVLALPGAAFGAINKGDSTRQALTFRPDGKFKIAIIEDLHYGEAPASYGPVQDALTTNVIGGLLDNEADTDFVVFNGDIISRDDIFRNNTARYIDQMVAPLVNRSLPWATLYGNHDPGYNRSTIEMRAQERTYPGSRTLSQVPNPQRVGVSNYYLPVFDSDCPAGCGCTPELLIWFFDSRSGFAYQQLKNDSSRVDQPSWVAPEAVDWFRQENMRLTAKYRRTIPSIAFVHIPVNAFTAIEAGPGIDPQRNPGLNDMEITGQAFGWCQDGVKNSSCAWGKQDIPFMEAISSTPGLMAMFSAHIHGASWCYKWTEDTMPEYPVQPKIDGGLNICFGQHTGYGGAGDWERGSRLLLLQQDKLAKGELDTWIRLESSEVVGSVTLNATYGQDAYPATPITKTFCDECIKLGKKQG
ncbi:calcineurin-like phosphoesterase [Beauveria brongniartii RCEF 3172]|uniref:Calcineurin-like phosphoesterase n=1 Tax=Beauveria brongniartii RCEF 3172 TaxID=1081107 RepID=A0A167EHK7_9HYPO|nr:calcineurin-like phosphoesterase [Beauveria brongniartii RCEF 3172]